MIEYELIRKKIKNVYIGVKNGKVIVRAPIRLSKQKVDELINQKSKWINDKLQKQINHENFELVNKEHIYILGKKIKIEYKEAKKISIELNINSCVIYSPKLTDEVYSKILLKLDKNLKDLAYEYIIPIVKKYSILTGLKPQGIVIRKFKSIWGNCSSKKIIKLNQKLIHYNIKSIEYVCLHEITHLKYMNHQKQFWNYIKKYMPDYKERANLLKQ